MRTKLTPSPVFRTLTTGERRDLQWRLDAECYARNAVRVAVDNGTLVRSEQCERADGNCSGRLEAHHHLGYAIAHWLHVQWLCVRHHRRAHRERKAQQASPKQSRIPGSNRGPLDYESSALPLS
jgi:hypothetical protein